MPQCVCVCVCVCVQAGVEAGDCLVELCGESVYQVQHQKVHPLTLHSVQYVTDASITVEAPPGGQASGHY